MYYIYKIQNILTDEIIYIGYTGMSLRKRFRSHKAKNIRSSASNHINEYGRHNFFIAAIDTAETKTEAFEKEAFWTRFFMARCDTLLNKNIGNEHTSSRGISLSEETRRKISEKKKNYVFTREHKRNMVLAHTKILEGEAKPRLRSILLVNTGEIFLFVGEAEEKYLVPRQNILNVCVGKRNYAGKLNGVPMVWKFVE